MMEDDDFYDAEEENLPVSPSAEGERKHYGNGGSSSTTTTTYQPDGPTNPIDRLLEEKGGEEYSSGEESSVIHSRNDNVLSDKHFEGLTDEQLKGVNSMTLEEIQGGGVSNEIGRAHV